MDEDEYKRLLAAYEADKEKGKQNSTQIQLNNYTPKYLSGYSNTTQSNKSKDDEIWELKQKIYEYEKNTQKTKNYSSSSGSKAGIGFVCAFFLGIIGLIIGLIIYKDDEEDRRSFLKGWGWTFGITLVLSIFVFIVFYVNAINYTNDLINGIYNMISFTF